MDANPPSPNPESDSPPGVEGLSASIGVSVSATGKIAAPAPVFRRLSSFSTTQFRKLKARHEEFIRSMAARLSGHLRVEVGINLSRLETMPYGKLINEFANPTHIVLLKLEP